ncbi:MAG: TetR/AcrR family transcriptional regulator [Chitinophagaceae bacterium]|nr:TetR/AcrR family transcriptional regulator [Chitinophagaceae bacterium]
MKKTTTTKETDISTEEKIRNAARKVFHSKGFAATRTRDIAEEAGMNLALLNYYFRSKEKLFALVMQETMQTFIQSIKVIFNDESLSLEAKVELLAGNYIEFLGANPDLPIFMLSEMRRDPSVLAGKLGLKEIVLHSHFMQQFQQGIKAEQIRPMHPFHLVMNIVGLTVFPFIAAPMLKTVGDLPDAAFTELMQERKALIPLWVKAILKA